MESSLTSIEVSIEISTEQIEEVITKKTKIE